MGIIQRTGLRSRYAEKNLGLHVRAVSGAAAIDRCLSARCEVGQAGGADTPLAGLALAARGAVGPLFPAPAALFLAARWALSGRGVRDLQEIGRHHRAARGDTLSYTEILFDVLIDPFEDIGIPREILGIPPLEGMHWSTQSSGIRIPDLIAAELEHLWPRS